MYLCCGSHRRGRWVGGCRSTRRQVRGVSPQRTVAPQMVLAEKAVPGSSRHSWFAQALSQIHLVSFKRGCKGQKLSDLMGVGSRERLKCLQLPRRLELLNQGTHSPREAGSLGWEALGRLSLLSHSRPPRLLPRPSHPTQHPLSYAFLL